MQRITAGIHEEMMTMRPYPLSQQQQMILSHLWCCYHDVHTTAHMQHVAIWGVPWRTHGTRSQQASVSRALRQLERRGLVQRMNYRHGVPHRERDRTDHVKLSSAGREIARHC